MALLCLVSIVAACAPHHVYVPPLPEPMTREQRLATFQLLRQRDVVSETTGRCSALNLKGCNTDTKYRLTTAGGLEITEGDDVIPVIHPQSTAAKSAREILRRRKHQTFWRWFIVGTVAAGVIVAGIGGAVEPDAKVPVLGLIGAGVIGAGFTTGYVMHRYHRKRIQRESGIVFSHYDQALAQRLDVCVAGMALVPCEGY